MKLNGTRKPYEKPVITRVRLEVEETVLAACKTTPGKGPQPAFPCKHPAKACLAILGS